jgi:apolipoprotein N-acyltransferase
MHSYHRSQNCYSSRYLLAYLDCVGLITPFAFAPFGYIPTIFIGHLILFWLIFNSKDNKQAFKIGLVFGLSEYLLGFYWMFSIVEGYDINYQIVMSISPANTTNR